MATVKKAANAIGGRTARPCDGCLRKRARWYCAADDAFLCHGCDTAVHSANRLAGRHERTRLQTSSSSLRSNHDDAGNRGQNSAPAWHHGFTRKPRTPRPTKPPATGAGRLNPFPLVPEISGEEIAALIDEEEDQFLCRVPDFNPFSEELYEATSNQIDGFEADGKGANLAGSAELDHLLPTDDGNGEKCDLDLRGFLSSDIELAEFAADVEKLLGRVDDGDDNGRENPLDVGFDSHRVKIEDEEVEALIASHLDPALDMAGGTCLRWDLNVAGGGSMFTGGHSAMEEEVASEAGEKNENCSDECKAGIKKSIFLRLNYEEIITAWSGQTSPWTTGTRPVFNPDDCLPHLMGTSGQAGVEFHAMNGGGIMGVRAEVGGGGEREARVSRYREKRRTRLFSKKIRYEVRKLNAEKRPRMKGRFVKRSPLSSVAASNFSF